MSEEEFQDFVVEQFGKLGGALGGVHKDVDELRADVTNIKTDLASVRLEVQTGMRELRAEVAEIKEILEPLAKAFDRDAEKIVEHDRRIGRLEQHAGIAKHA